jgi:DNA-binding transcriptional ArsR family regulator
MESDKEDHYCMEILTTFMIVDEKKLGFNVLAKYAKDFYHFSRPTLSHHLKHLVKKGLVTVQKNDESKLKMKPSLYSLNRTALHKYLPNAGSPAFEEFMKMDGDLSERSFKQLSWRLLQSVYFGDLVLTKLFLESLHKTKSKKDLHIAQTIMWAYIGAERMKLVQVSRKAKEEEFQIVLKEFDCQIERALRFYETGELDGEKEKGS